MFCKILYGAEFGRFCVYLCYFIIIVGGEAAFWFSPVTFIGFVYEALRLIFVFYHLLHVCMQGLRFVLIFLSCWHIVCLFYSKLNLSIYIMLLFSLCTIASWRFIGRIVFLCLDRVFCRALIAHITRFNFLLYDFMSSCIGATPRNSIILICLPWLILNHFVVFL